jgi:hypothetical protein
VPFTVNDLAGSHRLLQTSLQLFLGSKFQALHSTFYLLFTPQNHPLAKITRTCSACSGVSTANSVPAAGAM